MTPDLTELDRMLATDVMGWIVVDGYLASLDPNDRPPEDWHPTTDIAQAIMVAKKIGGANTPALAICLAARAWLEAKKDGDAK